MLAPKGCSIIYGELSGPTPASDLHQLFSGSFFATKYNGMHWVEGLNEFPALISEGLTSATKR
jgi:hypothetical protein